MGGYSPVAAAPVWAMISRRDTFIAWERSSLFRRQVCDTGCVFASCELWYSVVIEDRGVRATIERKVDFVTRGIAYSVATNKASSAPAPSIVRFGNHRATNEVVVAWV
jgi:hypothetical protein